MCSPLVRAPPPNPSPLPWLPGSLHVGGEWAQLLGEQTQPSGPAMGSGAVGREGLGLTPATPSPSPEALRPQGLEGSFLSSPPLRHPQGIRTARPQEQQEPSWRGPQGLGLKVTRGDPTLPPVWRGMKSLAGAQVAGRAQCPPPRSVDPVSPPHLGYTQFSPWSAGLEPRQVEASSVPRPSLGSLT